MPIFLTVLTLVALPALLIVCYHLLNNKKNRLDVADRLVALLPMINCEQCGYISCSAYVDSLLAHQEINGNRCPHQNIFDTDRFLRALRKVGLNPLNADSNQGFVAQVLCQGGINNEERNFKYDGINQCAALYNLTLSTTNCTEGCLGLGDCLIACPEDAITITKNGLAQIDKSRCTGCGLCVDRCPTTVIKLLPSNADYYVACAAMLPSYRENPSCTKLCTGCAECIKVAPLSGFTLKNNLCSINYQNSSDQRWKAASQCPNGSIIPLGENGTEHAGSKKESTDA